MGVSLMRFDRRENNYDMMMALDEELEDDLSFQYLFLERLHHPIAVTQTHIWQIQTQVQVNSQKSSGHNVGVTCHVLGWSRWNYC